MAPLCFLGSLGFSWFQATENKHLVKSKFYLIRVNVSNTRVESEPTRYISNPVITDVSSLRRKISFSSTAPHIIVFVC